MPMDSTSIQPKVRMQSASIKDHVCECASSHAQGCTAVPPLSSETEYKSAGRKFPVQTVME